MELDRFQQVIEIAYFHQSQREKIKFLEMFFNTAYSKVTEMKLFPAKFSKNDMDFFNPWNAAPFQ